ncbi:thioesterase II family protein [Alteromonas portus]|uniref:thioesterase II family protein n=1 Tax=Alteromonas portus TaxID=2565549 RepID=UPI003BF890FB
MINNWFVKPKLNECAKMRLFCFPYAGGNASTYIKWQEYLPNFLELIIVQPPGRANRISEPVIDTMDLLVKKIFTSMLPLLDRPFVFFGHSLGSRVAYELSKQLQLYNQPLPKCLITSASAAAHLPRTKSRIWELDDDKFKMELKNLGGTSLDFFEYPELVDLLLPMIKADFKISEQYQSDSVLLELPIYALAGEHDTLITNDEILAWNELTTAEFKMYTVQGGHFFIDSHRDWVVQHVINSCSKINNLP